MSSRREQVLLDIGLGLLVLMTIGVAILAMKSAQATATLDSDPSADNPSAVPADQPTVVVLGDAFTNGGEEFDGETWSEIVAAARGWTVETSAPGGSGYVTPGGGRPLPERVPSMIDKFPDADLWVLAAGASDIARDIPVSEVVEGATEAIGAVEGRSGAQIILMSPFAVGAPSQEALELRDRLRDSCEAATRCTFFDATAWFDRGSKPLMDAAGLNPTQRGQRVLSANFLDVLPAVLV